MKDSNPVAQAIANNELEFAAALIASGADFNGTYGARGEPLLHHAIGKFGANKSVEWDHVIQAILSREFDINEKVAGGYSALHIAIIRGNFSLAKVLLEKGANPNTQADEKAYAETPLRNAAMQATSNKENDRSLILALIENGANTKTESYVCQSLVRSNLADCARSYGWEDVLQKIREYYHTFVPPYSADNNVTIKALAEFMADWRRLSNNTEKGVDFRLEESYGDYFVKIILPKHAELLFADLQKRGIDCTMTEKSIHFPNIKDSDTLVEMINHIYQENPTHSNSNNNNRPTVSGPSMLTFSSQANHFQAGHTNNQELPPPYEAAPSTISTIADELDEFNPVATVPAGFVMRK